MTLEVASHYTRAVSRPAFIELLHTRWRDADSMLCVGLDPDSAKLPVGVSLLRFCCDIVDATADLVCAFKPQIAHFAAAGAEAELAELIAYIQASHPDVPVILDAKRGDVPSTAAFYAVEAFERYGADAVTVNPYLGPDSVEPFLAYEGRGVIVLARTSNPDARWLQDVGDNQPVFLKVAREAASWNSGGNVGLVAGATGVAELAQIRRAAGEMPLLVPGVGSQGGSATEVVAAGANRAGYGLVINASRSVLYAVEGEGFAEGARAEADRLVRQIRAARLEAIAKRS